MSFIRNAHLVISSILLMVLSACSGSDEASGPFILVTVDTTRADRIGAYGGTAVPTPHFDRLAREGVRVESGVSQVPLTLPAHSSMFTGRYPVGHGVKHNGIYQLLDSEETLAERFQAAGFRTAGFVAAYVLNSGFGTEQGFDTYGDVPVNRYAQGQDQLFLAERTAAEVNEQVFQWLAEQPDENFFLWVHYYDPHDPYTPPEDEAGELVGEGYDREISYLDHRLGDLWTELESKGWWNASTIVLAADHGESLGEHNEVTHGIFLYEGAVDIPIMLKSPALPKGKLLEGTAELVDLAPTLLEIASLPALPNAQGESLLPRIRGEATAAGLLAYGESHMPKLEFGWSELWMVRDQRFKYIEAPNPELYDLREDPSESNNLFRFESERAAEMQSLLSQWRDAAASDEDQTVAKRTLSPEEEAKLKSLGYLGGDFFKSGEAGDQLPDPKEQIVEVRALDAARDLLVEGDFQGALDGVQAILNKNPSNHQARTTKVLSLIELEDWPMAEEEALAALAAATLDRTGNEVLVTKARGLLASVYQLSGKPNKAEEQYLALLEANPEQINAMVDLARLYLSAQQYEKAEARLEEALKASPEDAMAWSVMLRLSNEQGNQEQVLAAAEQLAEIQAGESEALIAAGRLFMKREAYERAARCFNAAFEQPGEPNLDWVGEAGVANLAAGNLDRAERLFLQYSQARPSDPRPWGFLTRVALSRGDLSAAEQRSSEALARDPRFVTPLLDRANAALSAGQQDFAKSLFLEALQRNRPIARRDPLAQRFLENP